jgi:uncharacterized protein
MLRRYEVDTNVLTLVTSANASKGKDVYNYLLDNGVLYHQYIPCVEFDKKGQALPFSLTPEAWGEFLCTLFDQWVIDGPFRVSVRYFDALLQYLVTGEYNLCHMDRTCSQYFMVEYNGDIYPCDFFAEIDLRIGNICNNSWYDLLSDPINQDFRNAKSNWNTDCDHCTFLHLCSGDCLKHRLHHGKRSPRQKSWLCKGYRMFFDHALPTLQDMAAVIKQQERKLRSSTVNPVRPKKIGRNQPCTCGSGNKYKKCCGAN